MSTKEDTKIVDEDPKIDPDTGLPEGLDPGYDYMDKSPHAKSEPIPLPYGSRLVGIDPEEALVIEAQERVERAEAAVEAEKETPQTADEELAAAKKELAEAEKAKSAAETEKKKAEDSTSTPKTTARTS